MLREKQIMDQTLRPHTSGTLELDLRRLGVAEGDALLVHSSLSNIGWVCGGAQAVILALMGAVGSRGSLVMPTMTGDLSDPGKWNNPPLPKSWLTTVYESLPLYDPDMSPSLGMGKIPETFRKGKEVLRSAHPLASFAAWGKGKEELLQSLPLIPQFGEGSVIHRLYEKNARVLLLGTDYSACTCFHLGEARWKNMPKTQEKIPHLEEGRRCWKEFQDFDYDNGDFHLLGLDLEKTGAVKKGIIGEGGCRLFSLTKAVDFAEEWIAENR